MILTFKLGGEIIKVKVENNIMTFATAVTNYSNFVPIDGLGLSKEGIIKEHPDLTGKIFAEMKIEAVKRFKEYIKEMKNEKEIMNYTIKELAPHGYKLILIQRDGFRTEVVK